MKSITLFQLVFLHLDFFSIFDCNLPGQTRSPRPDYRVILKVFSMSSRDFPVFHVYTYRIDNFACEARHSALCNKCAIIYYESFVSLIDNMIYCADRLQR